ncbi:DUF4097 family beta strand repeat-containing protein [Dysgonomonas sp. ZJ279]|uniref:DUF4097 family beta strand repeat-containing protein n=1 Tax=Dysgonomonas sp. ZJ279 TaxID=2709796 RepID=UPI0013EA699D|nr:DUF4097 family beta strand repeat-containing protein [Dysgonomonas sp. ZJ279]
MKKNLFYTAVILFCLIISPEMQAEDHFEIDQSRTPVQIEKKSFSNISKIEIKHLYGDIFVRESATKQVELEIQYLDQKAGEQVSCETSTSNNILSIQTNYKGGANNNNRPSINYIISIPRNTGLSIDLKYGNIKMNPFHGPFMADLSYSDLSAKSLTGSTPSVKIKYGNMSIENAPDILVNAAYSDIKIDKANNVNISGDYNNYVFNNAHSITSNKSLNYGDIKVTTVTNMNLNIQYGDVKIGNLVSNLDAVCLYSDIKINNVSPKISNVMMKGSYSDMTISLPQDISVSFDLNMNYGDVDISKTHNVTYTQQSESDTKIVKIGKIGSKSPTGKITVISNYGDLKIK